MEDERSKPLTGLRPMSEDFSIEVPETTPDDADEKRKKSVSKSKQWKEFVDFGRQRQEAYRAQTPGGVKYNNMPKIDAAFYSAVGNAVIEEMESWINFIQGSDNG